MKNVNVTPTTFPNPGFPTCVPETCFIRRSFVTWPQTPGVGTRGPADCTPLSTGAQRPVDTLPPHHHPRCLCHRHCSISLGTSAPVMKNVRATVGAERGVRREISTLDLIQSTTFAWWTPRLWVIFIWITSILGCDCGVRTFMMLLYSKIIKRLLKAIFFVPCNLRNPRQDPVNPNILPLHCVFTCWVWSWPGPSTSLPGQTELMRTTASDWWHTNS